LIYEEAARILAQVESDEREVLKHIYCFCDLGCGVNWKDPCLYSLLSHSDPLFLTTVFPQKSSVRLGNGDHHFEILLPFPVENRKCLFLFLFPLAPLFSL
jgi:hypothetical protein